MLLFVDDIFLAHETGQHPESPIRLRAIRDHLNQSGILDRVTAGTVRAGTDSELLRAHSSDHIKHIEQAARHGTVRLDPDTVCSPRSAEVARFAAGTACAATEEVVSERSQHSLALLRPPGHHALRDRPMGFCLYNNIAIAARHAQQQGAQRILIIDWDVHHGNGTEAIFYDDPDVHYLSIHRFPFYPGTGRREDTGTGPGLGTTYNIPIAFGTSRPDYFAAFQSVLDTAADRAQPELILISAGFDAHRLDPIGSLGLESEDFSQLTNMVQDAANVHCRGRFVSLLEGGYHPASLADSVQLHLEAILAAESAADVSP